jgi:diguanylate cyclase (GGDEF)-like protein
VNLTVSIGISIHPDNGRDAEVLLRAADYAMYLAKGQGKNRSLVCPEGLPGPTKEFRAE